MKLGMCLIVLSLTGCASRLVKPEVITIDRPAYVRLPASLLTPCPVPEFSVETNADLAEAILRIRGALVECDGKVAAIKRLQP